MKRIAMALAAFGVLTLGALGTANAVEFNVGPGGVYVGPHRHYYDEYGNCRVIITHHVNRWGNEVTERRRVCD